MPVLKEISDLYLELEREEAYCVFDNVYLAKDALDDSEDQWYWLEATRENIDFIIWEHFRAFIDSCENDSTNDSQSA